MKRQYLLAWSVAVTCAAPALGGVVYSTLNNSGPIVGEFVSSGRDDITLSDISNALTAARVSVYGGTSGATGTFTVGLRRTGSDFLHPGTSYGSGSVSLNLAPGEWQVIDVPLPSISVTSASIIATFLHSGPLAAGTGAGVGYNSGLAGVGVNGPFAIANGFVESVSPPLGLGFDFELVAAPTPGSALALLPLAFMARRRR